MLDAAAPTAGQFLHSAMQRYLQVSEPHVGARAPAYPKLTVAHPLLVAPPHRAPEIQFAVRGAISYFVGDVATTAMELRGENEQGGIGWAFML